MLAGGKPSDKGLFYPPTVLVDVDHGMDCMREETFGPTLPVMKVRDAQEAIEKANDSRYGLSGSVWTRDKAKGMALAKQMATGSVNINNAMLNILQYPVPYAGWKESGDRLALGRRQRHPQVLPGQEHRRRPGRNEKGTVLVPVHPEAGEGSVAGGQVARGQGLAASARAVISRGSLLC